VGDRQAGSKQKKGKIVPIKHETTKHEAERVVVRRIDEGTTDRSMVEIAGQEDSIEL
jgi:hypothetical protein